MAFPAPAAAPTGSNATADDASPFTVTRPAGVSGRLVLVLIGVDGNPTLTWPSGYTEFFSIAGATSGFKSAGAWHLDDGTEGTTLDITSSASEKWGARVYSITGAEAPATQAPEAATLADQASSATPDGGPSLSPTGGAKDYLWLSWLVMDGEEADDDTWGNSCPTGFTDFSGGSVPHQKTSAVAGVATTNVSTACCQKQENVATQNPGTYGVDVAHTYHSVTIAVHPTSPNALVTPSVIAVAASVPSETTLAAAITAPSAVAATAAIPAATLLAGAITTPSVVGVSATVPTPTIIVESPNALVTPATVAATVSIPAPAIQGAAKPTPAAVAATGAVPTTTISGTAIVTPSVVAAAASVPTPAILVGGDATVPVSTVAAMASVSAVVVLAGAITVPATVISSATVGAPGFISSPTASPATITALASVPTPSIPLEGQGEPVRDPQATLVVVLAEARLVRAEGKAVLGN